MKQHIFFITLILFSPKLSAQEIVNDVLDAYIQIIGGQKYIDKAQSIYSFADCIGPNGKYQTEIHSAKGSKTIFRQIKENKPDYIGIVNGTTYWTKGNELAVSNDKFAFAWRSHEVQWIATHLTERFHDIKFIGNEKFAGKQAVKFSATDELNKTTYLFFEKTTNMFLGLINLSPFNENQETIRLTINTWKKIGKLLLPSKVTYSDKQGEFILNFHTIKINKINENVFEVPKKIIAIKRLIELHELQRTAHFNRDAKLLVSILADDYTEINNGKVTSSKKEDLIKRFQDYFDLATFIEWDDITPPIIEVSDDATIAYVLVNKRVKLTTQDKKEELTIFAWTATFKNINGNWLMTSITSTVGK